MIQAVAIFRALVRLEWKRRRRFLLVSIVASWVLGVAALVAFPSVRDGSMSGDVVFLATALFGTLLTSDAFAKDAGSGHLEFLFANGARPGWLFLARSIVVTAATALFAVALLAAESARLRWTSNAPMADRWIGEKLSLLASNPREALALYLLPALGIFLVVSAVSSRTSVALGFGACAIVLVVALDRWSSASADVVSRQRVISALGTAAIVPASIALAAAAVFVRRVEPERSRPRAILAIAGAFLLAIRFVSVEIAGDARVGDPPVARAIAVSPDGRRFAIEGARVWRPGPRESWAAGALGRPLDPSTIAFGPCVAVASIDGTCRLASPLQASLESGAEVPAWVSDRHLRLRGQDPSSDRAESERSSALLFDAERGVLRQAPSVFHLDVDGAERQKRWSLSSDPDAQGESGRMVVKPWSGSAALQGANDAGEVELTKLAEEQSLRVDASGAVLLVDVAGKRTRVWPLK